MAMKPFGRERLLKCRFIEAHCASILEVNFLLDIREKQDINVTLGKRSLRFSTKVTYTE